jgi:hypothetical protein
LSTSPEPPVDLADAGRRLWSSVLDDFELGEHEVQLLVSACRCADTIEGLDALVAQEGLMSESSQGSRVHPAVVEARSQRLAFARLLAALNVPLGAAEGASGSSRKQPKRSGVRGVYGIRGAVS